MYSRMCQIQNIHNLLLFIALIGAMEVNGLLFPNQLWTTHLFKFDSQQRYFLYNSNRRTKSSSNTSFTMRSNDSNANNRENDIYSQLTEIEGNLCRKPKQVRRKFSRPRRPSAYWQEIENIDSELRSFWESIGIDVNDESPLAIPNEALLNHFDRHDLRYAIANFGGREYVAQRLGGAELISGKWNEACRHPYIEALLSPDNTAGKGLSKSVPPIAPHVKRALARIAEQNGKNSDLHQLRYRQGERWAHQVTRKPRGYWSEEKVLEELYEYLKMRKAATHRPSVWMPKGSEISNEGRDDLRQAMIRYGGLDHFTKIAKLIPYNEWRYFESHLELFVELEKYLLEYENGNEDFFPKLSDIEGNGYDRLYFLIMEYGGRKLIATKLDMNYQSQTKNQVMQGLSLGRFSLSFAIRLMCYIRNSLLKTDTLKVPKIRMPTTQELIKDGEEKLAKEVIKYGGHESIARRLNLSFDADEARRDARRSNEHQT